MKVADEGPIMVHMKSCVIGKKSTIEECTEEEETHFAKISPLLSTQSDIAQDKLDRVP